MRLADGRLPASSRCIPAIRLTCITDGRGFDPAPQCLLAEQILTDQYARSPTRSLALHLSWTQMGCRTISAATTIWTDWATTIPTLSDPARGRFTAGAARPTESSRTTTASAVQSQGFLRT